MTRPEPSRTAATTAPQRVFVVQEKTPETLGIDNVRKEAAGYFATAGKVGAMLGSVKSEDVQIVKRTAVFRPYWKIVAGNAYRFSRTRNHSFHVEQDVESIVLMNQTIAITPQRDLEQLVMETASNTGDEYGAAERFGDPSPDIRSRAMAVATGTPVDQKNGQVNLANVTENALYVYVGKFLFDGVTGTESKETFDLLKGKEVVPVDESALKTQGNVIAPTFTREQVVEETTARLAKRPKDMAGEPTEHQLVVGELSLIYLPYYEFTFAYKDKTRTARLDGVTGKMEET